MNFLLYAELGSVVALRTESVSPTQLAPDPIFLVQVVMQRCQSAWTTFVDLL
jgi:hypothetical protein